MNIWQEEKIRKYVICFLLGDSLASDLYMPTFRNTLSVPSSKADLSLKMEQIVFRNVGIYKSDAGESPKRKQTTYFLNFPSLPNIRNERGLFILFDRQTPAQIPASIVSQAASRGDSTFDVGVQTNNRCGNNLQTV